MTLKHYFIFLTILLTSLSVNGLAAIDNADIIVTLDGSESITITNAIAEEPAALPAFPGAEGHGKYTTGGRGGKVYFVTTLADTNSPGSLRYAVQQVGARIIIFHVSGTINLNSELKIENPNITLPGKQHQATALPSVTTRYRSIPTMLSSALCVSAWATKLKLKLTPLEAVTTKILSSTIAP